jgi:hypothetical protein
VEWSDVPSDIIAELLQHAVDASTRVASWTRRPSALQTIQ